MDSIRYIGLDLHWDAILAAVLDSDRTLVMQSVLATRAAAIIEFLNGIRGALRVTFEECNHSAWLYDLPARRVDQVLVCDRHKKKLLKSGHKSDQIDAHKLAELLRMHSHLCITERPVRWKFSTGNYTALTQDTTRVMGRLKAVLP